MDLDAHVLAELDDHFALHPDASIGNYTRSLASIGAALGSAFTTAICDARSADIARIRARWPNAVTYTCKIASLCSAITHSPALAASISDNARAFWDSCLNEALALRRVAMTHRQSTPRELAQIPDLAQLRAEAAAIPGHGTLEESQNKTLLTLLANVPTPVTLTHVAVLASHGDLVLGQNAVVITPDAEADAPVDFVVQSFRTADTYDPIARSIDGEFARVVRASLAAWPRAFLFVRLPVRKADRLAGVHEAFVDDKAFYTWAMRVMRRYYHSDTVNLRGTLHAWATQYICPDPGPHETPLETVCALGRQTGRSVEAVYEAIKDGGPEARAAWPAPPDLPIYPTASASLAVIEELAGAAVDIGVFRDAAAAATHDTLQDSMRAAYIALAADPGHKGDLLGMGGVRTSGFEAGHFSAGAGMADDAVAPEEWVRGVKLTFNVDLPRAHFVRADDGVEETLGAAATEALRTSLDRWPRAFLFGDNEGAVSKRRNGMSTWVTEVLSACADRLITPFGLRCAKRRVLAAVREG